MADPTSADTAGGATREVGFRVTFRGYDRHEVDEYVRELRTRADRQASALRDAEQRLAELGADASVPLQVAGSGGIGARIERIVALAESEAAEIREQAERDVARMRSEMEYEADQARRFREQAAKASAEESRELVARAKDEVEQARETRRALLAQLSEIGEAVDEITGRLTAPEPRRPLGDEKPVAGGEAKQTPEAEPSDVSSGASETGASETENAEEAAAAKA